MNNQPVISIDSLIYRINGNGELEILLVKRWNEPFAGQLALPGVLLNSNESITEAARRALLDKADIKNEYIRGVKQFKVFDTSNRDPRGNTIAIACFTFISDSSNTSGTWVNISRIKQLPFDHNLIINESLKKLHNPDESIIFGITGNTFTTIDYKNIVLQSGGELELSNLIRIIPSRLTYIKETESVSSGRGRKKKAWEITKTDYDT